jgi:hypothetical protein
MLPALRALGADPPFADRRRGHGVAMEGHFWRFADPASGRVVVALCGVCRDRRGSWANVALATHPGGLLRAADLDHAAADPERFAVSATGAAGTFRADAHGVSLDLGPDARLQATLAAPWPARPPALGGVGIAHLIPGLGQYWDPHLMSAAVAGHARLGDTAFELDGFSAYAEKNWSPTARGGFPAHWWWGQASSFARPDVAVAFAGGEVTAGPLTTEATAIVVRLGDRLIRLGNPLLAPVRARAGAGNWSLRARGPRWSVALEGAAGPAAPFVLPIPLPAERRSRPAARQHLDGHLHMVVRRRGRIAFAGGSPLAGLEVGAR